MTEAGRIRALNRKTGAGGKYVLYWMQQSQRTEYNHALEYAIEEANRRNVPVLVCFGLTDSYPEANARHYAFMLQGLEEVARSLFSRGIGFVVHHEDPASAAVRASRDACLMVTDRGYLAHQVAWRERAAREADCPVVQVETDVVVPVEEASPKEEYSAGTFRPKIKKKIDQYLLPPGEGLPKKDSLSPAPVSPVPGIGDVRTDRAVFPVTWLAGGTAEAKRLLDEFIETKLDSFGELRNDPSKEHLSHLSPYLHFGQISPLYIALKVMAARSPGEESFLEELIVRRELGINFVRYNPYYDSSESLPAWAKKTLADHASDRRPYHYTPSELEAGETHDEYWNAAQREMVMRGKMHGYMRMYWGKKILEWSKTSQDAYRTACRLNNRYSLDGRDPSSYAGVAWCFGKHDRAWQERPVFGKVRFMNDRGLKRKFDIDAYVRRVANLDKPG